MSNFTNTQLKNGSGNMNSHNTSNSISINLGAIKKVSIISIIISLLISGYHHREQISIFLSLSDPVVASNFFSADQQLYVITKVGKIRSEPSTKSEPIAYLNLGDVVIYLGERSSKKYAYIVNGKEIAEHWLKVKSGNKVGFIWGGVLSNKNPNKITRANSLYDIPEDVKPNMEFEEDLLSEPYEAHVIGRGVNVRKFPTLNAVSLASVNPENRLMVTARSAKEDMVKIGEKEVSAYWYKITLLDGARIHTVGWLFGHYLERKVSKVIQPETYSEKLKPVLEMTSQGVKVYKTGDLTNIIDFPKIWNSQNIAGIVVFDVVIKKNGELRVVEVNTEKTNITDSEFLVYLKKKMSQVKFAKKTSFSNVYLEGQLNITFRPI